MVDHTLEQVKKTLSVICQPGAVYELRAVKTRQGTKSGYFDDLNTMAAAALSLSGKVTAVYVTLNPVNPDLLSRATNRLKDYATNTTNDNEIIRRVLLLIDADPVRPADISATEVEKELARAKQASVIDWLEAAGISVDSMITADSGNGYHILLRIDLPNTPESTQLCQRVLEALSSKFSDDKVKIDTSVFNPARISKIYGTLACKGDSTTDRPHRLSKLLSAPEKIIPATLDQLTAIADTLPKKQSPQPKGGGYGQPLDIESFMSRNNIEYGKAKQTGEYRLWELKQCPFNPDHNHGEAAIQQFTNGAIDFSCKHNSCQGKTWADVRALYEPDYQERKLRAKTTAGTEHFNQTDAGNAEYFVSIFGDNLRYDHKRGRWLRWTNHYWKPDPDKHITRLALQAIRKRYQEAVNIEDLKARDKEAKWCIDSEQRSRLDAMVALAKDFKPIANDGEGWDSDPWLFGVKNGVVDLRTGKLRVGQQSDLITQQADCEFEATATAPRFERFLTEIFNGDAQIVDWLLRYLGYALTGNTSEQKYALGFGSGANGKGTLIRALKRPFGDYAYSAPFSTFEQYQRQGIPNDLAALIGRRFVTASETNSATRLNEARIKALTGQDTITARFLHAEFFSFEPVAKYFFAVNDKPIVQDDSYGFWRRIRLLPFIRQFTGNQVDRKLDDTLAKEAAGILNLLIRGCLEWQKRGLDDTPDSIEAATTQYKADSDDLATFLADMCQEHPKATITATRFYKAYKSWCVEQGYQDKEIMTNTKFGRAMGKKFQKIHKEGGAAYLGVSLKTDGLADGFDFNVNQNKLNPSENSHVRENLNQPVNQSGYAQKPVSPETDGLNCNPSEPVSQSQNEVIELPECPGCGASDKWLINAEGTKYLCACGKFEIPIEGR